MGELRAGMVSLKVLMWSESCEDLQLVGTWRCLAAPNEGDYLRIGDRLLRCERIIHELQADAQEITVEIAYDFPVQRWLDDLEEARREEE